MCGGWVWFSKKVKTVLNSKGVMIWAKPQETMGILYVVAIYKNKTCMVITMNECESVQYHIY